MSGTLIHRLRYNQPQWFYDLSPFIYAMLAALIYWKPGGPLATLSSALLALAAVWIIYMRWTHRRARTTRGNDDLALVSLVWDRSRECEHDHLDAEHRELFISGQELVAAANDGHSDVVDSLIRQLIRKLEVHFAREEKILSDGSPAVAAAHRLEHQSLAGKIADLHRGYFAGKVTRFQLIECLVYEAIVEHTWRDKAAIQQAFWD